MNHFNDMKYYSVPPLPEKWKAPLWLSLEIGLLAGRLYFPFSEYDAVCKFFKFKSAGHHPQQSNGYALEDNEAGADGAHDQATNGNLSPTSTYVSDVESAHSVLGRNTTTVEESKEVVSAKLFTEKPMTFLRQWLGIRRGGDFKHTPIGYLCEGRPLSSNHPFFRDGSAGRAVATSEMSEVEYESD
jgi:hypothetical protein